MTTSLLIELDHYYNYDSLEGIIEEGWEGGGEREKREREREGAVKIPTVSILSNLKQ